MALDSTSKALLGTSVALGSLSLLGSSIHALKSTGVYGPAKGKSRASIRKINKAVIGNGVAHLAAIPLLSASASMIN